MLKFKNNGFSLQILCALSLFLLFSICSLLLIAIGANNYKGVLGQADKSFNVNASLHYVTNKLHSYDKVNGVSVSKIGDVDVIVLNEDDAPSGYHTLIYFYDGYVCELFKHKNMAFKPASGQKVLPLESFSFSLNTDGSISITTSNSNNEVLSTTVTLKCLKITEVASDAKT